MVLSNLVVDNNSVKKFYIFLTDMFLATPMPRGVSFVSEEMSIVTDNTVMSRTEGLVRGTELRELAGSGSVLPERSLGH